MGVWRQSGGGFPGSASGVGGFPQRLEAGVWSPASVDGSVASGVELLMDAVCWSLVFGAGVGVGYGVCKRGKGVGEKALVEGVMIYIRTCTASPDRRDLLNARPGPPKHVVLIFHSGALV
jgi:hypothetical protein